MEVHAPALAQQRTQRRTGFDGKRNGLLQFGSELPDPASTAQKSTHRSRIAPLEPWRRRCCCRAAHCAAGQIRAPLGPLLRQGWSMDLHVGSPPFVTPLSASSSASS